MGWANTDPWLDPFERGIESIFGSMERRVRDAMNGTTPMHSQ
ncbi:MAG: hypothetical protein ABI564_13090 [Ideonella sp.]